MKIELTGQVKIAVNGGHALLHINHLHFSGKVHEGNILLLLNLDTPMVSGFEFLTEYKEAIGLKKENIYIAILDNGLTNDYKKKIEKFGIEHYVNLKNIEEDLHKIVRSNIASNKNKGNTSVLAA